MPRYLPASQAGRLVALCSGFLSARTGERSQVEICAGPEGGGLWHTAVNGVSSSPRVMEPGAPVGSEVEGPYGTSAAGFSFLGNTSGTSYFHPGLRFSHPHHHHCTFPKVLPSFPPL